MKRYQMLIGGEWVDAEARETFETENPYLGAAWAFVPRAKAADVDRAVEAAWKAFRAPSWAKISATARGALLRKLADLIAAEADRLAEIETRDNGKLITEMRTQLRYIPQWFNYFGGLADKIEGRVIPIDKPGMINFTREEPLGVVAAITPWNSPLMLAAWKLAPALAAGNTIVWKPSEFSSVSALEFGRLFEKAGFPPGVVNILTGFGSEIGERLVTHPHVAKIAFTGGDRTGQGVYELAARSIKPVTLELGGKSANIVFKDAAIDNAVKGVVSGIFAATGQTCIAGSRALIHRSIHNEFVDKLVALGETARMGDPLLDTTQVGPITTRPQFKKVLDYIEVAKSEGASCVLGGGKAVRARMRRRMVRRADRLHRGQARDAHRAGGSVRAGSLSDHFRRRRKRRSRSPTTRNTGLPRACGPKASGPPSPWLSASRPARSGSTPIGRRATFRPSAATSALALGVRAG